MSLGQNLNLWGSSGGGGGGAPPYAASDGLWWARGGVADGTDNEINDLIGTLDAAEYIDSNCIYFSGAGTEEVILPDVITSGDWYYEIDINPAGTIKPFEEVIVDGVDGTDMPLRFWGNTGTLGVRLNLVSYNTTNVISSSGWTKVVSKRVGSTITIESRNLDGSLNWSEVVGSDATALTHSSVKIGGYTAGRELEGRIGRILSDRFDYKFSYGYGTNVWDQRTSSGGVPINVIVQAGQSNMSGATEGYGSLPASLQGDQENFYSHKINFEAEDYGDYVHPLTTTRWSVEITAADHINSSNGDLVAFVKCATSGSSLDPDIKPNRNWYPDSTDLMYDFSVDMLAKSLANLRSMGYEPTVREVWWLQGEEDDTVDNPIYETQFYYLRQKWIVDTEITEDTRFVLGKVRSSASDSVVNTAITNIAANSWGELIDVYPYSMHDGVHINSAGIQGLGVDFADSYLAQSYTPQTSFIGRTDTTLSGPITWVLSDGVPHNIINGFGRENYYPEGDMENDFSWSNTSATPSFSTDVKRSGIRSLELESTAVSDDWNSGFIFRDQFTSTKISDDLVLKSYIKGTAGVQVSHAIYNVTDASFILPRGGNPITLTGGWDLLEDELVISSGKNVRIYYAVYDALETINIDDAAIIDNTTYLPIRFGDTTVKNTIRTNTASLFHNLAESDTTHTDPAVVDGMTADDGTATIQNQIPLYNGQINSKSAWRVASGIRGEWDGATKWQWLTDGGSVLYEAVSATDNPPLTGYTAVNGTGTLSIVYNQFYIDPATLTFAEPTFADKQAHYNNSNGAYGVWLKETSDGLFSEGLIYTWASHVTRAPDQVERLEAYWGGTGAALRDGNDDLITDVNGYVIFAGG